jgi:UDP-2,4-diacetamido-2,4,6-trideoxy-beta-L-altropyranose hydrolase
MRCLALADELRQQGAEVSFVCREAPGWLGELVTANGFALFPLPLGSLAVDMSSGYSSWLGETQEVDAEQTLQLCSKAGSFDWLIVDHYAIDAYWERILRRISAKVMVIDDLANRPHDCDLLLDQNLATGMLKRYVTLVPDRCVQLLGPRFALLRPAFRAVRKARFAEGRGRSRLFIFLGGSDPEGYTSLVLDAIEQLPQGVVSGDVVVGAGNIRAESLRSRCQGIPGFRFHQQITDIELLMANADLAVCSTGSVTWERCCLGLPAVTMAIADNQAMIGVEAAAAGLSVNLGAANDLDAATIAAAIAGLLGSEDALARMSAAARSTVDGFGARRVSCQIMGKPLRIAIASDAGSWIAPWLDELTSHWRGQGHTVTRVADVNQLPESDLAFYLACGQPATRQVRARAMHNLVVHESALPQGRGWAPLTWQILKGENEIPVVLIEAEDRVDSGDIYLQEALQFRGHELCDELRHAQGQITKSLCIQFVNGFPELLTRSGRQYGEGSIYRRRTPDDSRLDLDRTLREQFNLLRVVDNERYPAFFELNGYRYQFRIERLDGVDSEGV